jgi:hypothetical protein
MNDEKLRGLGADIERVDGPMVSEELPAAEA